MPAALPFADSENGTYENTTPTPCWEPGDGEPLPVIDSVVAWHRQARCRPQHRQLPWSSWNAVVDPKAGEAGPRRSPAPTGSRSKGSAAARRTQRVHRGPEGAVHRPGRADRHRGHLHPARQGRGHQLHHQSLFQAVVADDSGGSNPAASVGGLVQSPRHAGHRPGWTPSSWGTQCSVVRTNVFLIEGNTASPGRRCTAPRSVRQRYVVALNRPPGERR